MTKNEVNVIHANISLVDESDQAVVVIKMNKEYVVSMAVVGALTDISWMGVTLQSYLTDVAAGRRK